MCEAGCTVWGHTRYPCIRDCNPYPEPKIDGNRLVGANFVRAPLHVFRFTLQGFNQSIVDLSLLSETA
jgi:hypothetical protein